MEHEKENENIQQKEIKPLHCLKYMRNLEVTGSPSPSHDSINIHLFSFGCLFGPLGSESGS
jgi:hypothetical protein